MSERPELVIVGVGNRYRTDDAVGLHLVAGWQAAAGGPVATELWEDVDGAAVAHRLVELACPVLLVDCAELGLPGGAFRLLDGGKVQEMATRSVVSTHGIGLAEGMQLAAALGHAQPLWVFGVQPFAVSMGETLSPAMAAQLPGLRQAMVGAVKEILRQREA
ncbi:MAG: hydrogenase maturation protease [Desulfobulbaceae bacterium]|nr:hydrogenase maturation protease [Desulfobulbaceae bacterium]